MERDVVENNTEENLINGAQNTTFVENSRPVMETFHSPNGDPLVKRMRFEEEPFTHQMPTPPLSIPPSPALPQPTIQDLPDERSISRTSTTSSGTHRLHFSPEPDGRSSSLSNPQEQRRLVDLSTPLPLHYDNEQPSTSAGTPPPPFIGDISQIVNQEDSVTEDIPR